MVGFLDFNHGFPWIGESVAEAFRLCSREWQPWAGLMRLKVADEAGDRPSERLTQRDWKWLPAWKGADWKVAHVNYVRNLV